jgi:hypothetical protein
LIAFLAIATKKKNIYIIGVIVNAQGFVCPPQSMDKWPGKGKQAFPERVSLEVALKYGQMV